MTEVAQVAAAVAHNVDDVANENEFDVTHRKDDKAINEDDTEKTSHTEDKKQCENNDKGSKTDETHMNGVEHKDRNADNKKNEGSEAVNGEEEDTDNEQAEPDTNEDQNLSDLAMKKQVSQKDQDKNKSSLHFKPLYYTMYHSSCSFELISLFIL